MTDFPIDTVIFNKIVEVFNQTRSYVLLLFPLAFFIRIVFGFIFLRADSFIEILKDSLFLFLGLFFFTDILKMVLQIPYFVSTELSFGDWRNINLGDGIFTKALKRFVDWIGIISYWISFGLYIVIVSILGFFAGYILFFGTMFRAYGLLKVFFILLFTVSLWPLLWHSINFAVYTIAVSDNALANNVLIGGASLAKVFVPLWLISKTSKIPVAQALKKVSFTGGSLAVAGGSYATSFFKNNISKNVQNGEKTINEGAEIKISNYQENSDYIGETEDFSIREQEQNTAFPSEKNIRPENALTFENQEHQSVPARSANHVENKVLQENHVQNDINKDIHIENNPQVTKEISQNISQSHNESILEKPQSESLEHERAITEQSQEMFNEAIHREDWVEEEENYLAPRRQKNPERESEL